jgi:hypothetical protein
VLGRSRLIVLIELAIFAAELEMYARTSIYVREAQDLVPGPSELHDLHTIEGVIALGGGNKAGALRHLSESVRVCQEDDFARVTCSIRAPNLELATKLLWHSEQKGVIAYLAGCQLVWLHLAKQIDTWIDTIRNGEKPEFHSSSGILSAMDRPETKLRTLLIKASFSDTLNPGIGLRGTRMGFEKTLTEYKRRMAAAISGKLDTGKN